LVKPTRNNPVKIRGETRPKTQPIPQPDPKPTGENQTIAMRKISAKCKPLNLFIIKAIKVKVI